MLVDRGSDDDQHQWKKMEDKLYQARIELKQKTKSSDHLTVKNDHIYSSDDYNNSLERFNDIRGLCDHFVWNVINNDSHIFTFTTYKIWDKLVCSLSDIDLNSTYEYVCQYGL
jgi:hypothetical protein